MSDKLFAKKSTSVALMTLFLSTLSLLLLFYANSDVKRVSGDSDEKIQVFADPFLNIELLAQSAFVLDIENQKPLYALNPDKALPLASITKVMTAVTALDLIPPYTIISMDNKFLDAEGDSGLIVHERWRLDDLVKFSLVVSSNDAALAIASSVGAITIGSSGDRYEFGRKMFIRKMNEKARELGMSGASFSNESGLDTDEPLPGATGSAKDIAVLFSYFLKKYPGIFESTTFSTFLIESQSGINHTVKNTNVTTNKIPGLLASKTGLTNIAGGNLAIAFDPYLGRPIVVVVLGSTQDGRFDDVSKLVDATMKYLGHGK